MVGLDIKSHQCDGPAVPCNAVVQGNEVQDQRCDEARQLPAPADVMFPTGGAFAAILVGGREVTSVGHPLACMCEPISLPAVMPVLKRASS